MLTSVNIQNYRSCVDVHIDDMGYFIALIGRNGAGKTTILKALNWLAHVAMGGQSAGSRNLLWTAQAPTVTIEATIDNVSYAYKLSLAERSYPIGSKSSINVSDLFQRYSISELLKRKVDKVDTWENIFTRNDSAVVLAGKEEMPLSISGTSGCIPAIMSLLPRNDPVVIQTIPFANFLGRIKYYPIDETSEPASKYDREQVILDSTYKQVLAGYKTSSRPEEFSQSVCMKLIHMHQTDKKRFDDLVEYLGKTWLKLIDGINVNKGEVQKDSFYFITFTLGENLNSAGRTFGYEGLSLGTRRILQILTSLVFDDSSVMLIEHPEDGIHPGLLSKLVSLMDTAIKPTQLLVTSHSETLLNMMKPSNIIMATMKDNVTTVRSLTVSEVERAKKYINEDGTLYEYLEAVEQE